MTLTIGRRAKIDSRVQLVHGPDRPITIGDSAKFFRGTEILGPVMIGNDVFINRDAYIRPNTRIGDGVRIGPFVRLITDTHDLGPSSRRAGAVRFDPITIGGGELDRRVCHGARRSHDRSRLRSRCRLCRYKGRSGRHYGRWGSCTRDPRPPH